MAFYGIPMFGEGLVSKTLDNTIKGKGSSVAQQQLNRGLQQTRRGMMGQAAADRSNPALAVRNAMLAGSQAATDTNMQAAQLRAQEQATAVNQRMAQNQQQNQQFFGQLGAIGKGLAASGVLSPEVSAAVGAASGLAPGQSAGQPGGNISTPQAPAAAARGGNISTPQPAGRVTQPLSNPGALGAPQFPAQNIASAIFGGQQQAPAATSPQAPVAPTPPAPGDVRMVNGIATTQTGLDGSTLPAGTYRAVPNPNYVERGAAQSTAFTDPVIRSNENEMVFGLPGQQPERSPAQAVLAGQPGGNISTTQPYQLPGAPIPVGPQAALTPEQAEEAAQRIARDREVRGLVDQASMAVLPSLIGMGPLVPGAEQFSRSKYRQQGQEPSMVYQDPGQMVFSYDPQDAQRMAQQYGAQQGSGAAAPVASSAGNAISQDDIESYVRMLGGR